MTFIGVFIAALDFDVFPSPALVKGRFCLATVALFALGEFILFKSFYMYKLSGLDLF